MLFYINIMEIIIIYSIIIIFIFTVVNYLLKKREYEFFNNDEYILPKKIFAYWDNLENNQVIKSHINNWKRNISNDWELIILNKNNVKDYVSDTFLNKYSTLDATRFSDFLRLELLRKYGGVWMDASIIVVNGSFLDNYWEEMHKNKYDILLYELKGKSLKDTPYLENWFIMARKDSKLINDLYYEFDKSYEMGFLNYKKAVLIPSGVKLDKTIKYNKSTYLMQHAIINYLLYMGNKYNINMKDACESMFKVHHDNKWVGKDIMDFIMINDNWEDYYAIKLVKSNRKYILNEEVYIEKINML